ncbi:BCCT family transporter [Schauerella aestuarii]|uniref:BCCT family transporter n=1 Tax=Schauerella aestuarii TaxID=2511204 RepID=UPI00137021D2|nr:choline BCCT transporter BetT [Achromobacter aestuarii]MYZ42081.1 BCCT family transporter [Achromobacter aestuarii]
MTSPSQTGAGTPPPGAPDHTPDPAPKSSLNPPVFYTSAALVLLLVAFAVIAPDTAARVFGSTQDWILTNASWFYILTVAIVLVVTVFLAISRYGDIKLGPDHSEPDYRNLAWFAMLFSAGMGIGIMFFGVAEPVMHFIEPPIGEPGTAIAAREAMKLTFFHWGLHAWALYAIVALILAFFSYRHGLPLTLRSALFPIIGNRIHGPIGHAVDIFAIIGTVLGVATSLGLGVEQINSGLNHLWGVPISTTTQIILIVVACGCATLSVASGLDKGIKILSELNLGLAAILMLFVLIAGPTVFILQTFVQNTGGYLSEIVSKTFNLYAYNPTDWIGGWTLFYWGWWLAWSPFVGMFIARISRGRTIREFICGVLFVPAGFTLFWMTVFGDSALHMILIDGAKDLAATVDANTSLALFAFLEKLPFSSIVSVLAIVMVIVFFVTSADSGALVVDLLASGGREGTPMWQRVFWSLSMGAVAIALLLADGLTALQTATIASALPFSVILLLSIWGLFKALKLDATKRGIRYQSLTLSRPAGASDMSWQRRLRNIVMMPRRTHVVRFIADTVRPAFNDVAEAWRKEGYTVTVSEPEEEAAEIVVSHNDLLDFTYAVHAEEHTRPSLSARDHAKLDDDAKYFRAEVHLREGGQDYDIMGWTRDDVIGDILDQYERHRHYLHVVR